MHILEKKEMVDIETLSSKLSQLKENQERKKIEEMEKKAKIIEKEIKNKLNEKNEFEMECIKKQYIQNAFITFKKTESINIFKKCFSKLKVNFILFF